MPAVSTKQQMAMAIAEHNPSELNADNSGLLKMSQSQLHDFAATKRKGLPEKAEHPSRRPQYRARDRMAEWQY